MKPEFNLWSKNNPEALKVLNPDLGMRGWNELTNGEKNKIFNYLFNKSWFIESPGIFYAIDELNNKYKRKSFGAATLEHSGPHINSNYGREYLEKCCLNISLNDFNKIILNQDANVVYELISIFAFFLIDHRNIDSIKETEETKIKEEKIKEGYSDFDKFAEDLNDIFEQFCINVQITRSGIIIKQDPKITRDIYIPVINFLSNKKWAPVNRDLSDAFKKFQEKTPVGYSGCITHTISALQAYLQILVYEKTGTGDINKLIQTALTNELIPNDSFTKKIFKDIESILMEVRQKTGDPHPKKEYADEKTSLLVLNLFMIFIQHTITTNKTT